MKPFLNCIFVQGRASSTNSLRARSKHTQSGSIIMAGTSGLINAYDIEASPRRDITDVHPPRPDRLNEPLETKPLETKPLETEPLETGWTFNDLETDRLNDPLETQPLETEPLETKDDPRLDQLALALTLSHGEKLQLTLNDTVCRTTLPFNDRMHMWLNNLIAPQAEQRPDLGYFCDKQIPIPGWGDNFLEFKQEGGAHPPLMYPGLCKLGLSMFHGSMWAGTYTRLEFCDITKPCPAGQIWVWCAWCRKFQFPAESHRASNKHQKALLYLESRGPEYCASAARHECNRWL